jgi:hypothetical protein
MLVSVISPNCQALPQFFLICSYGFMTVFGDRDNLPKQSPFFLTNFLTNLTNFASTIGSGHSQFLAHHHGDNGPHEYKPLGPLDKIG